MKKWIGVVAALMLGVAIGRFALEVRQARLDRQLITAVTREDLAAVTALLHQGANPSTRALPPVSLLDQLKRMFLRSPGLRTEDAPTALLTAIRNGDLTIAQALAEAKADPNATDKEHVSPLALTLSEPERDEYRRDWDQDIAHLADRLLDNGANPNVRDKNGRTVLIGAVMQIESEGVGRLFEEIVRKMIRKGADVNAQDEEGKTALSWAAWAAFEQEKRKTLPNVMRLLLDNGVDARPQKNAGWSILNWAAYFDDIDLAQVLLTKGLSVNASDYNGRTALHVAISRRKGRFVRFLVERGANVNAADNFGMTPLMFAAQNDDAETARLLVQHRADVKGKEKDHGWTVQRLARYLHAERFLTVLKTGNVIPPVSSRAYTTPSVPVDATRRLIVRYVPHSGQDYNYILDLASRDGARNRITVFDSGGPVKINMFRDGDGSPVVFVRWETQGGGAALYRLEGMRSKEVWNEGTRYGSDFCPLKDGGCIVWTRRPAFQETSGQDPRADDEICLPYYYRNGKCTELEYFYFPGCLKQM